MYYIRYLQIPNVSKSMRDSRMIAITKVKTAAVLLTKKASVWSPLPSIVFKTDGTQKDRITKHHIFSLLKVC